MTRFPTGTPYVGPTMCYDDQIEPEQLLRRIIYGMPAPLLGHRDRMGPSFWGKLVDGLSNSHAVVVKITRHEQVARNIAAQLRKELPEDLYSIGVLPAPELGEWRVLAYNKVPVEVRRKPIKYGPRGPNWITVTEVARILKISKRQVHNVIAATAVEQKRKGARNELLIKQSDLVILANRPGRWRNRKRKNE